MVRIRFLVGASPSEVASEGVREAVVTLDMGVAVDEAAAISGDVVENRFLCDSILLSNEEESLDRMDCKLAVTRPVVAL